MPTGQTTKGEIVTRRFLIERKPNGDVHRIYVEEQRRGQPFWRRVWTPTGWDHGIAEVLRPVWNKPPLELDGIQIVPLLALADPVSNGSVCPDVQSEPRSDDGGNR